MAILFIKADQLGLFDKLVPVKASIRKDGVVTSAHTAIRHVRAPEAPKVHHPAVQDLFAHGAAHSQPHIPAPDSGIPRNSAPTPDYHETQAKAREAAKERIAQKRLLALRTRRDPEGHGDAPMAAVDAKVDSDPQEAIAPTKPLETEAAGHTGGLDYSAGMPTAPSFGVAPGVTKGERRAINARAAAMVKEQNSLFEAPAEPVDLAVLRQYSGWGGCGDSLNEFYTDPQVAAAMWTVLHGLGAVGEGATVLEPSCGTGVFMATAPVGVKLVGVEMDQTSSKIASLLHPAHEIINSSMEAFATTDVRQFDAVIGNPPFGDSRGSLLAADKSDIKRPENYFTDTALDKCKPGGIVALVLPHGTMDSGRDRKLRARLLCKGEFLGALRMPNTAFEASHTGVVADVVFFRKRPDDVAAALSVIEPDALKLLGAWDEEFVGGGYFDGRGAENVLGAVEAGWRAKAGMGDDITVEGSMIGVPETIAAFSPDSLSAGPAGVADVLKAAGKDEALKMRIRGAAARKPYDQAKRGDTRVIDGVTYVLDGEPLRWHRVDEFMAEQAVVDAGVLGADIERAINGEDVPDLKARVEAFVAANGIPAKNPNLVIAAKQDKLIYRLLGAVKPDGSLSDVVTGRKVQVAESSFDAAAQTLALEVGYFTPSMVAGRWHGGTEETVLDHLYASPDYALDAPSGTWTSLDNYLTGELWPKLDAARAALAEDDLKPEDRGKIERQAAALEAEIDPKSLEDVEIMLNSGFIPLDVVAAFFNEMPAQGSYKPEPMAITYDEGFFLITGGGYRANTLYKYLNRDGVKKEDDLPTIERWNREFKDWLCASPYRDQVEEDYNRKFRGFRQKAYSNAPFEVPGLNDVGLKDYQWGGLRWALEAGKGIIAADVGLGKTARALILNKLMKTTGQARRPMIVVPKSVAANWMREAQKWFPGSTCLVIGETYTKDKDGKLKGRPDNAADRDRKFHDLRQNEYDFVLITQPAWQELDLAPDIKEKYQADDFWEKRKKSMGKEPSAKQLAKQKEAHDARMVGQDFQKRTESLYFNDLGVDAIISDEMHAYKNLFAARDRFGKSPKFLGGSGNSKRAADMRYKTNWLRDQTGGRNVYGLTATPTKNSPLEVYSMLTHIAPEAFEHIGIRNSEDFLDRFCVFEERNILDTSGRMTRDLCVTGFKNLGELREIMRRYIDRKTAADVGLELPAVDDQQHLVDISAAQKEVYADLRDLADKAKNAGSDASGEAHPFSIMSKMDKATLDLELYDPVKYAGAHSPKIDDVATRAAAGLADGGQVIFCDFPEVHQKIVEALVAKGVPRDQIGVLNGKVADTSAKRQNLSEGYRARKLRVMIGNSIMEEGVDGLQEGTADIHHMNIPWTASAIQQRNGRAVRQGNTMEGIRLHNYLGKGTFDGYRYQTVAAKKDWQTLLWSGGDKVENLAFEGGLSHEEMLIALSEDPDAARAELAKNKGLAQSKLDAEQHQEAAASFASYKAMKATAAKMGAKDKLKPSGQRLAFKLERMRDALERNPYFKAKHALDADHPVLIQPQTGDAFEPGKAFQVGAEGKVTAGHYIVEKVHPDDNLVQVRRYGEVGNAARLSIPLDNLNHAVTFVEHDAEAEGAHIATKVGESLAAGVKDLKTYKQLRDLPTAAIEANKAAIGAAVREGIRNYTFGTDHHGKIAVLAQGKPTTIEGYSARSMPDGMEPMLPTGEHQKMAFDAYADAEAAKKWAQVAITGRRGSHKGYETKLRYPGGPGSPYGGEASNPWKGAIEALWGPEGATEAHSQFEARQHAAAKAAPTLKDAIGHLLPTSIKLPYAYGTPEKSQWSKEALATMWHKAKEGGHLDSPLIDHLETKDVRVGYGGYGSNGSIQKQPVHSEDHFATGAGGSVVKLPVRQAIAKMAIANGHQDLADAINPPLQETADAA